CLAPFRADWIVITAKPASTSHGQASTKWTKYPATATPNLRATAPSQAGYASTAATNRPLQHAAGRISAACENRPRSNEGLRQILTVTGRVDTSNVFICVAVRLAVLVEADPV